MAWLTAATKLAPHVLKLGEIAVTALPHFSSRKSELPPQIDEVTRREIAELQAAATRNAETIRQLAADLKSAITGIEDGGKAIEARFRRLEFLAYSALVLSIVSAGSVVIIWLR
jgi:hypothetical protein